MEFNQNLAALRKSKNLSQEEIADRLGVSRQAISKWENGQALPETANIIKLCEILGVTPNELLGYENNAAQPVEENLNNEEKETVKKKWYKTMPFKVFVAVLAALLAVQLIKVLIVFGFTGVFMMRSDVNNNVLSGEVVSVEDGESIATGGVVKFSTRGTIGNKTLIRTEYVPNVYSSAYECSFAFSRDGMLTVTEEAEFEGGMWVAEVELPQTAGGAIEVVFITDTGTNKVLVKIATLTEIGESNVAWQ